MSALVMNKNKELIEGIKERILDISGGDEGRTINFDGVVFRDSGRSGCGGKISITCLFINEDGNVCADMYRSGSAGCVDFICGLDLNSLDEKVLKEMMAAIFSGKWSVVESPSVEDNKKKNPVSSFKIPFLQKGA
jgi:hypothetical protein